MAHELEMIHGKAAMAYVRRSQADVPWHGLGEALPEGATPDEMLQAAQLDWEVEKKKAFVRVGDKEIETGQEALVRTSDSTVLTNVGPGWNPVQNHEAFEFFEKFVEAGEMTMETAGSLKNGQIVWALAKTTDAFRVFEDDVVESYVLFTNPHQYGKTLDIRFTPIRVVCNNTLTLAHTTKAGTSQDPIRLNHRQPFDSGKVQDIMVTNRFRLRQYGEMAKMLGSYRAADDDVNDYINELLGNKELSRTGKKIKANITEQPGADIREGSWWQVFNAVTYTVDHQLGRQDDSRLESAWYGANSKRKWDALELAGEYIRKSSPLAA